MNYQYGGTKMKFKLAFAVLALAFASPANGSDFIACGAFFYSQMDQRFQSNSALGLH
jgi:hypothetical protein